MCARQVAALVMLNVLNLLYYSLPPGHQLFSQLCELLQASCRSISVVIGEWIDMINEMPH